MVYKVVVMPSAQADMEEYADFIGTDSRQHAQQWLILAWQSIFSLAENPGRFAVIEESVELGVELRDIPHYSHRIVYRILEKEQVVEILRVWHGARRSLSIDDIEQKYQP
jgi:plasmid stabilization system protein ParE